MDRAKFFAAIRSGKLVTSLTGDQVQRIEAVIDGLQARSVSIKRAAYILATAFHESDRFRTLTEYASGAAYEGRKDLGNTQAGDGKRFKGRGLVQITGRRNYTDWSKRLGVDIVAKPELAATLKYAVPILIDGMLLGTFTGKKLGDYVDPLMDFKGARRVVNGTDRASLIADYAGKFLASLKEADYGSATVPVPPAAPAQPTPTKTPALQYLVDLLVAWLRRFIERTAK
jgi:predicted chitinase